MDSISKKILIVDDEESNLLLLEKILFSQDYNNITTTLNPLDVCELQKNNNFDLIILDINMPELNGYEVLSELHKLENISGTKVIASSGHISKKDIEVALDAGFDDYLTKPMNMIDILSIVKKSLEIGI